MPFGAGLKPRLPDSSNGDPKSLRKIFMRHSVE